MRILCLSSLYLAAWCGAAAAEDLLAGVRQVGVPGVPGLLSVFGPDAEVVLTAPTAGAPGAVAARTALDKGRIVVFSHGFWSVLDQGDTRRLIENTFAWAGRKPKRIALRGRKGEVAPLLALFGPRAKHLGQDWIAQLGEVDLLFTSVWHLREEEIAAVRAFVKRGGGLVTGGPGWGWQQLNPQRDLAQDNTGNRLLAPLGIVFGGGTIRVPDGRLLAALPPDPLTHAARALEALTARKRLGPKRIAQATATLSRCIADLPPDDDLLLPALDGLLASGVDGTPPLEATQGIEKVLLSLRIRRTRRLPAEKVRADPAAAQFPGAIAAGAPRVARTVEIDLAVPGWHSTGLYAAPGELVRVKGDPALRIRVGCHKDLLWHKPKWDRAPEITREEPLGDIANAFGGLIYVVVPKGRAGVATVEITGAVEAPLFLLGATSDEDWKRIRTRPAPWAELATGKVIITVPSAHVRGLDRPGELMRFWDGVMDACADLATRPRGRERPERYVADMQISAGYMHAGYPIMTHLDAAPRFVDLTHLRTKGDWGMFHEMGHNHQHADWTFSGTTEVTCNLFSLYVIETLCPEATGHQATSPEAMRNRIERYRAGGRRFEQWKREPFLALILYRELQQAFGWESFRRVFAEYRALPDRERPKSDAEKRDQFLVRFSRAVGRNLGPFFESWGVPTTRKARESIAGLPTWRKE